MSRNRIKAAVVLLSAAALIAAPGALAASPQAIYRDYADNGRLDGKYTRSDLERALNNAVVQAYGHDKQKGPQARGRERSRTQTAAAAPAALQAAPRRRRARRVADCRSRPRPQPDRRRRARSRAPRRCAAARRTAAVVATETRVGRGTVETALGSARPEAQSAPKFGVGLGLRPQTAWAVGCLAVDVAMLPLAAARRAYRGQRRRDRIAAARRSSFAFSLLCLGLYWSRGLYRLRFRLHVLDDLRSILVATSVAAMVVLTAACCSGRPPISMPRRFGCGDSHSRTSAAGRVARYWAHERSNEAGEGVRSTLIVGAGRVGALVAKRLLDTPELGLRPVAFLDKEPLVDTRAELGVPVVGASWDLDESDRALRHRAGRDHVLDRPRRGAPTRDPALRGPRDPDGDRAEAVRAHAGAEPDGAPRRTAARHAAAGVRGHVAVPHEVRLGPRGRRALARSSSRQCWSHPRSVSCSPSGGPCSSGRCASAATVARSRC